MVRRSSDTSKTYMDHIWCLNGPYVELKWTDIDGRLLIYGPFKHAYGPFKIPRALVVGVEDEGVGEAVE